MEFYNLNKDQQEIVLWAIERSLSHEYKQDNNFQKTALQNLLDNGVLSQIKSLSNKSLWLSPKSIQEVLRAVDNHTNRYRRGTEGFRVYYEQRYLNDEEIKEACLYMDSHGSLVKFEPFVNSVGDIIPLIRPPSNLCITPK